MSQDPLAGLRPAADQAANARAGEQGDARPEPGVLEAIGASARTDQDVTEEARRGRVSLGYYDLVDTLEEMGVDTTSLETEPGLMARVFAPRDFRGRGEIDRDAVWRAAVAAGVEDLPDSREDFEQWLVNRQGEAQDDYDILARHDGWVGPLAGGAISGMAESNLGPLQFTFGLGGRTIAGVALREGVVGGADAALSVPDRMQGHAAAGREYGLEEMGMEVGGAAAGGFVLGGIGRGAAPVIEAGGRRLAPVRQRFDRFFGDRQRAAALRRGDVPEGMTPEAAAEARRALEIEDASPFDRTMQGDDLHIDRLTEAADSVARGRPLPAPAARANFDQVKAAIRGPESGGDDAAVNGMGSSASGRYQFIESTFVSLYQREFGVNAAAARRVWANDRFNVDVQERLMDRLLTDNANALERAGQVADTGNLYLAHFAGAGKAIELLRARPSARVAQFFSQQAVAQNPTYLGGGRTVEQAINAIRGVVGDAELQPGPRTAVAQSNPMEGEFAAIEAEEAAVAAARVRPDVIEAELPGVLRPLIEDPTARIGQPNRLARELGVEEDHIRRVMTRMAEAGELERVLPQRQRERVKVSARRWRWETNDEVTARNNGVWPGTFRRPRATGSLDALQFIASRGGIAEDGLNAQSRKLGTKGHDLRNSGSIDHFVPGHGPLIRPRGRSLEDLAEDLWSAGYFGPTDSVPRLSETEMIDWLDNVIRKGERVFLPGEAPVETGRKWDGPFQNDEHEFLERQRWGDAAERMLGRELSDEELFAAMALELDERMLTLEGEEALDAVVVEVVNRQLDDVLLDAFEEVEDEIYDAIAWQFADAAGREGEARAAGGEGPAPAEGNTRAGSEGSTGRQSDPETEQLTPAARDELEDNRALPPPNPETFRSFKDDAGEGVRNAAESDWHDIEARAAEDGDGQADFAKPTQEQRRIALERQGEGRLKGSKAQKAAGEDGGLFDGRGSTDDLFDLNDGAGPRRLVEIQSEIVGDRKALDAIRECLK